MPIDNKYGRVVLERGDIGEDEPVVVFRARDPLLPKVLMYYHLFCTKIGSPDGHLDLIMRSLRMVQQWQRTSKNMRTRPASASYLQEQRELGVVSNNDLNYNQPI